MALSYLQIYQGLSEHARTLLHQLYWFAQRPIPTFLFQSDPPTDSSPTTDVLDCLDELHAAQVMQWQLDQQSFLLNPDFQTLPRYALLPTQGKPESLLQALDLVNRRAPSSPDDPQSFKIWSALAPHIASLTASGVTHHVVEPTARLLNQLGLHVAAIGQWNAAENFYRQGIQLIEAAGQPESPDYWTMQGNLASLLWSTNRVTEAEPLMRRALENHESIYGPNHPNVARDLNNLATLLQATNRLTEAEPLMQRALKIDEANFGPNHPSVAIRLNNLAQLFQDTNRLMEAEPLMQRVVTIFENTYGLDHPSVATALNNLAQLLQNTNRLMEAEPLMCRALKIDEASYGSDHPKVAIRLNNLAGLLYATNRLTEAEPLMQRVLTIFEKAYGLDHPNVATALNNLARLCRALGRLAEAEPFSRRAVDILVLFKERNGHEHPEYRNYSENYRYILAAMDLPEEVVLEKLRAVGVQ